MVVPRGAGPANGLTPSVSGIDALSTTTGVWASATDCGSPKTFVQVTNALNVVGPAVRLPVNTRARHTPSASADVTTALPPDATEKFTWVTANPGVGVSASVASPAKVPPGAGDVM